MRMKCFASDDVVAGTVAPCYQRPHHVIAVEVQAPTLPVFDITRHSAAF